MNSIRGYIPEKKIYQNEFFEDYIAYHSIFKDQKIKIRLFNKSIIEVKNIKSAIDSAVFKISFIEHKNIIKVIEVVEENDKLAVVYENKELIKILDILNELNFDEKISQILKIIEAIEYLNNKSLLLGIFSPDLFFFDEVEGEVILGEIGLLSIIYNAGNEEIKQKFHDEFPLFNFEYTNNSKIDFKTDSYVAGQIMYNFLCSCDSNILSQLPDNFQNLIHLTFEKDPLLRPKIQEIKSFLETIKNKNVISGPIQSQIPTFEESNKFINEDFENIETNRDIQFSESKNTENIEDEFNENKINVESSEDIIVEFEELQKTVTVEDNNSANISNQMNYQATFREKRDNPPKFEYKPYPNTKQKQPDFVGPLVLSIFALFTSIFISFAGIILAIISLSKLSKQKKIVRFEHKRALSGSEISVSRITIFINVFSIIIGFLFFLSWIS